MQQGQQKNYKEETTNGLETQAKILRQYTETNRKRVIVN
jgi:hypothetical protein